MLPDDISLLTSWSYTKIIFYSYIYIYARIYIYMSNGLNLLHPRKDVAEMVIVFCVSLIVPEDLMFAIKSGEHVYQESSFFVSPLSFLRVSWWYQVSMSWCNCSKMSEVLAGAHIYIQYDIHNKTTAIALINKPKSQRAYQSRPKQDRGQKA